MFWHEYAKIPRVASKNPIAEGFRGIHKKQTCKRISIPFTGLLFTFLYSSEAVPVSLSVSVSGSGLMTSS